MEKKIMRGGKVVAEMIQKDGKWVLKEAVSTDKPLITENVAKSFMKKTLVTEQAASAVQKQDAINLLSKLRYATEFSTNEYSRSNSNEICCKCDCDNGMKNPEISIAGSVVTAKEGDKTVSFDVNSADDLYASISDYSVLGFDEAGNSIKNGYFRATFVDVKENKVKSYRLEFAVVIAK